MYVCVRVCVRWCLHIKWLLLDIYHTHSAFTQIRPNMHAHTTQLHMWLWALLMGAVSVYCSMCVAQTIQYAYENGISLIWLFGFRISLACQLYGGWQPLTHKHTHTRNMQMWNCAETIIVQITLYTSPYVPEPIFWISSYSSWGLRREISELSKSELCAVAAAMPPPISVRNSRCVCKAVGFFVDFMQIAMLSHAIAYANGFLRNKFTSPSIFTCLM